ncbi:MAG: ModD protein [Alphaproteobacteria bacterium]|jgi:molybdenum transport protein|nr:ModD protein [Alphaproteobacteria bacterium]
MSGLSEADLDALLAQDAPYGDLTTDLLDIGAVPGRIRFAAREAMVLSGGAAAAGLLRRAGAKPEHLVPDGTALDEGQVFLSAEGPAGSLHRAWKVAQTLVEYAAGIATRARRIVNAARAVRPEVVVACTRKNFPGTKAISSRAVLDGGASMHRLGLSETLLVFPEHRAFLDPDPNVWLPALKARAPEKKVVVEADSVAEAVALATAGADVLQLEKLSPADTAAVVAATRDMVPLMVVAVAGGVTEANAAAYAEAGAAVLVTSAPYFGRPCDVKVALETA